MFSDGYSFSQNFRFLSCCLRLRTEVGVSQISLTPALHQIPIKTADWERPRPQFRLRNPRFIPAGPVKQIFNFYGTRKSTPSTMSIVRVIWSIHDRFGIMWILLLFRLTAFSTMVLDVIWSTKNCTKCHLQYRSANRPLCDFISSFVSYIVSSTI